MEVFCVSRFATTTSWWRASATKKKRRCRTDLVKRPRRRCESCCVGKWNWREPSGAKSCTNSAWRYSRSSTLFSSLEVFHSSLFAIFNESKWHAWQVYGTHRYYRDRDSIVLNWREFNYGRPSQFAEPLPFSICNMPISLQRYSIVIGCSVKFSMLLEKVYNSSFKEPLDREIE